MSETASNGAILSASRDANRPRFDPKAEAKLRMKLDLFLVPTVSLLYLFCFIDRANIGKINRFHAIGPF